MRWFPHPEATKIASKVFPAHRPRVRQESTGKLCRLDSTPQGRVEIVRTEEGPFLVAAERPPRTEASIRGISLPPDLVERWNKAGLRPWKAIARDCRDVCEVIPALTEPEPAEERPAAAPADALLLPPPPPRKLVGSGRILLAERLAALTGAHACLRPLPQLVGPSGIGRRTLTAALGPLGFRCSASCRWGGWPCAACSRCPARLSTTPSWRSASRCRRATCSSSRTPKSSPASTTPPESNCSGNSAACRTSC